MRLPPRPAVYEINTAVWLQRLGRAQPLALDEVPPAEWDALAALPVDAVWLMGVWERSPAGLAIARSDPAIDAGNRAALPDLRPEDVIGSPYCVRDYVVDRRFGGPAGLAAARAALAERGLGLILDYVPNHVAPDHPWAASRPECLILGSEEELAADPAAFLRTAAGVVARGRDPYFPPWPDVVQLDAFSGELRDAVAETLIDIGGQCDGVRCDMAMLHLNDIFANVWAPFLAGFTRPRTEFWTEAHAALPNLVLLAEAYWGTEGRLLDLGFSYSYDKALYDAERDANPSGVRDSLGAPLAYQNHLARFLENHDEPRRAAAFPAERLPAAGTLMGTLPGMRFYYQGELEGRKIRLPIMLRKAKDEAPDPISSAFFQRILQVTKEEVFHSGRWSLLPVVPEGDDSSRNLAVYEWRSEKAWKLIVVNVSGSASQGRVKIGDRASGSIDYDFYDQLNDAHYERSGEELRGIGLFVRREAFGAHLFDITPA